MYDQSYVNVSESMSNSKVKVHITVKKVSLGLQIMFFSRHIYNWNIVDCDVKQPIHLTLNHV